MLSQRWNITIGSVTYESNAVLTEGAALVWSQVSDQVFHRNELNGQIMFQDVDYQNIMGADFDTLIQVDFEERIDGTWTNQYSGTFTRTDCEVDEDNEIITVTPKTLDRYTNIMDAIEKKYNIVDLVPMTQQMDFVKRPIVQIYLAGSSRIMNYVGGSWWEQDVLDPTTDDDVIRNTYFFGLGVFSFIVPGVGDGLSPDVSGQYGEGSLGTDEIVYAYYRSDGVYRFSLRGQGDSYGVTLSAGTLVDPDDYNSIWDSGTDLWVYIGQNSDDKHVFERTDGDALLETFDTLTHVSGATNTADLTLASVELYGNEVYRWELTQVSGNVPVYIAPFSEMLNSYPYFSRAATFTSLTDSSSQIKVFGTVAYGRLLTNSLTHDIPNVIADDTLFTTATFPQPDSDIVPRNENFPRVLPLYIDDITLSDDNQTSVENYGRFADDALHFAGNYHVQQTNANPIYPILPSDWAEYSIWIDFPTWLQNVQTDSTTETINHVYKFANVAKYILAEVDSGLTHEENSGHSDFFYGSSNTIRGTRRYPFIAPKSNILVADYDKPASKAEITLKEFFTMLRDVFNVYWDVTLDNKLIFEHIDYFDNGGTYTGTNLGVDLTKLYEPKTGKQRTFGTNKYNFEKEQLHEIRRYEWMDEASAVFEGSDMVFTNNYVEQGSIKDINISRFSADIDYALVQVNDINKDGFFLFDANLTSGRYVLPLLSKTVDLVAYSAQNGYLAMFWLQENYLKYDLPALNVTINGTATTASSVKKNKVQEISTTFDVPIVEPIRLVVTEIGNGKIETLTRDLSENTRKLKLKHGTES